MSGFILICYLLIASFSIVAAVPIVLKESSPSGDTVIAISSSDPDVEKYFTYNFPNQRVSSQEIGSKASGLFPRMFSTALAGTHTSTGRGFQSFNPFFLPFFNLPFNFDGFGFNFGPWMRGLESQEPLGNGESKTVTAINDNGHVYGNVRTVSFDNAKSQ